MTEIIDSLQVVPEPDTTKATVVLPTQMARDIKALAAKKGITLNHWYSTAVHLHLQECLRVQQAEIRHAATRYPHPFPPQNI